jgi:hypothetical protein
MKQARRGMRSHLGLCNSLGLFALAGALGASACGSNADTPGGGAGAAAGGPGSDPSPLQPGALVQLSVASSVLEPIAGELITAQASTAETLIASRAITFQGSRP